MIILTERLQSIANQINKGERVADIGTDHGYLPLYLYEQGITENPIMADVSQGSLNKAKENAKRMFPGKKFDFRLGDGLEVIEKGEVDTVIMAGIGGNLTIEILDWDISKVFTFKKMILQPRNNGGNLRAYLYNMGFKLRELTIVPEDRRFCEIMTVAVPKEYMGQRDISHFTSEEFDYPEELIAPFEKGGEIMHNLDSKELEYRKRNVFLHLENEMAKNNIIIENIKKGKGDSSENGEERIESISKANKRIKELMERI